MNHPIVASLVPVVLLIAIGFLAGKRAWIWAGAVRDLSNMVFLLLAPALLFRTMAAQAHALQFGPVVVYFGAAAVLYAGMLAVLGFNTRGAVLALAGTFSNTVMIGTPLVSLAYGDAALVTHFALVALHALVLLTMATIVLELASAREALARGETGGRHMAATVGLAVKNAVIHPVPLPILCGLAFAQTGLALPAVVDKPLQLLGQAFAPLALVLVGVTLAANPVGQQLKGALGLTLAKNLIHPALMAMAGWAFGLQGLALVVMVVAASLPIGANVFLFSQRYRVAEELVTATVAVSTLAGLFTIPLVMWLAGHL